MSASRKPTFSSHEGGESGRLGSADRATHASAPGLSSRPGHSVGVADAQWTDEERAAIQAMSAELDLSEQAVLRQALRLYQRDFMLRKAGETCVWSGDAQRLADFAGDLAPMKPLADRIREMQPPEDPHTDAWLLGFCRARKMAADLAFQGGVS